MACVARIFKVYASLYVCHRQTVIELVQQKNAVTPCFGSRRYNLELAVFLVLLFRNEKGESQMQADMTKSIIPLRRKWHQSE